MEYKIEEVKWYLEEMIQLDLTNNVEERVYEDLMWYGKCRSKDLKKVYARMDEWYDY